MRFNRKKGTFEFPQNAIEFCLKEAGITFGQLDCIAHSWVGELLEAVLPLDKEGYWKNIYDDVLSVSAKRDIISERFENSELNKKFCQVPHHIAHASSAFHASGFEESMILVVDGAGGLETTSVFHGVGGTISVIDKFHGRSNGSLAGFYGVMTSYLGFEFNSDEYKVMGLAPYGDHEVYYKKMRDLIKLSPGAFHVANNVAVSEISEEGPVNFEFFEGIFGPRRYPGAPLEKRHADIAAALQAVYQETILHICRFYREKLSVGRLCLAGGGALNCSANGVIQREKIFKNIYVCPASGDDGTAMCAALYVSHKRGKGANANRLNVPFLGPSFGARQVEEAIKEAGVEDFDVIESEDDLCNRVADYMAEGAIIGWFQGRMEFGPRALGARSILADPTRSDMRDRINALIKKREDFRPFAPAVLEELASEYFEVMEPDDLYPLMLSVTRVQEKYRGDLPSVTHVNGTARVQTVSKHHNPLFWKLINSFFLKSGFPVVLNTSFNVAGEPIVCTPRDAINTFRKAGLDYLVMNNFLVKKEGGLTEK